MHRRLPSFTLTSSSTDHEHEEETRSRSQERTRSRSPFNKRDPSAERLTSEYESEVEIDRATGVRPSNNFDSSDSEEEESETDEEDEQLERNTEVS